MVRTFLTDDSAEQLAGVQLRGTTAAILTNFGDRYDSGQKLYLDDAVHAGRWEPLVNGGSIGAFALGADRAVAWTVGHDPVALSVRTPDGQTRDVDRAAAIDGLTFAGHLLSWRHDGAARSAPVNAPDTCPVPSSPVGTTVRGGSLAVDWTWSTDGTTATITACWRATGATQTLSMPSPSFAITGRWLAAGPPTGPITLVDLSSGATRSIAADSLGGMSVDEGGAVAWLRWEQDSSPHTSLWIDDAAGTRRLDADTQPWGVWFDGSTLHWGNGNTATLSP
jgi:hypothetical protein